MPNPPPASRKSRASLAQASRKTSPSISTTCPYWHVFSVSLSLSLYIYIYIYVCACVMRIQTKHQKATSIVLAQAWRKQIRSRKPRASRASIAQADFRASFAQPERNATFYVKHSIYMAASGNRRYTHSCSGDSKFCAFLRILEIAHSVHSGDCKFCAF